MRCRTSAMFYAALYHRALYRILYTSDCMLMMILGLPQDLTIADMLNPESKKVFILSFYNNKPSMPAAGLSTRASDALRRTRQPFTPTLL